VPVKGGSIDHIAVLSARMKGWKTRTFTEKVCQHHREMGTAERSILMSRFKLGVKDYAIGNHPLWEAFRTVYQMKFAPVCLGGLALGTGYFCAFLRRVERPVPREIVAFHRREQMLRLGKFFTRGRVLPTKSLPASAEPGSQAVE
jgi:hypothetical protein